MPADLVVLATGIVPHDIAELVGMYHCAVGADGFLLEVHPKLRPVELAVSGVFLAGTCQGPMDITESCAAASAAASKAAALIAQGQVEMDPFIAQVDDGALHRLPDLPDGLPLRCDHPATKHGGLPWSARRAAPAAAPARRPARATRSSRSVSTTRRSSPS